jgi:Cyclic nucleotide-binding domain
MQEPVGEATVRTRGREELLSNIPLFESLTKEDLRSLARRLENVDYRDGEVIFRQGDSGSSLFVIEEGAVEISYGDGSGKIRARSSFRRPVFRRALGVRRCAAFGDRNDNAPLAIRPARSR